MDKDNKKRKTAFEKPVAEIRRFGVRDGVCLETQVWPDAVHHEDFPSAVLRAGRLWHSQTAYKFQCV